MSNKFKLIQLFAILLALPLYSSTKIPPSDIEVVTKGLVCDACAIGVKKWLKKNTSVRDVKLNTKIGITFIYLKDDKNITDKEIRAAIIEAGYESGKIKRNKTKED